MGDWGAIWTGNSKDDWLLDWWNDKPWTTFVVLGNHCNYNAIEKLPVITKFGAKVWTPRDSIFIAQTGNIYNLCGKKCLVINGADSHDKAFRKEGVSRWAQERITQNDINKALISLAQHGDEVDFIFSHTGGTEVNRMLGFKPTHSDFMLDLVLNTVDYDYAYCGHYHVNKLCDKSHILYNDIMLIASSDKDD